MTSSSNYRRVLETTPEFFYNWALNWYNEHAYGRTKKPFLKYRETGDLWVNYVKLQRPVVESNELLGKTLIIYFDVIVTHQDRNRVTTQEDPFPAFSFRIVPLKSEQIEIEIRQNYDSPEIAIIKDAIWEDALSSFTVGEPIRIPEQILTALPEIEDPTDKKLWEIVQNDPSITDTDLAQKMGNLGRQAVNRRRNTLAKMGYPVRVSRQNPQVSRQKS